MDEYDHPVSARLIAFWITASQGRVTPLTECSTVTNIDGEFECPNLRRGAHIIIAIPASKNAENHVTSRSLPPPDLPLFATYPDNVELDPAKFLHLTSGQVEYADIRMNTDRASEVQVVPATGSISASIEMYLFGDNLKIPINVDITKAGQLPEYTVKGVPTGNYLFFERWSTDSIDHEAIASVNVAAGSSQIETSLEEIQRCEVAGTISYPDQRHGSASEVTLLAPEAQYKDVYVSSILKDGSFTFGFVNIGTYKISIAGENGLYVSTVSVNGQDSQNPTIHVNGYDAHLILSTQYSRNSISGILEIEGEEATPGVLIHSQDSYRDTIVAVDAKGSFAVHNLPPGSYLVYGFSNITNAPYGNGSYLGRYRDKAVSVEVRDNSNITGLHIEGIDAGL